MFFTLTIKKKQQNLQMAELNYEKRDIKEREQKQYSLHLNIRLNVKMSRADEAQTWASVSNKDQNSCKSK